MYSENEGFSPLGELCVSLKFIQNYFPRYTLVLPTTRWRLLSEEVENGIMDTRKVHLLARYRKQESCKYRIFLRIRLVVAVVVRSNKHRQPITNRSDNQHLDRE